jgi:HEAT repeat protein
LKTGLHDNSSNVRLEAVKALGKLGGKKSINPLANVVISDDDPYLRTEALRTLRWLGISSKKIIDASLKALNDPVWEVRNQAARLLGNLQNNRSIEPLLKTLSDDNWSVRQSAEEALQNFGVKVVPTLIEALKSGDWVVRLRVARALGEIGDPRAIEPLKKAITVETKHPEAQLMQQKALSKLGLMK